MWTERGSSLVPEFSMADEETAVDTAGTCTVDVRCLSGVISVGLRERMIEVKLSLTLWRNFSGAIVERMDSQWEDGKRALLLCKSPVMRSR
jgi:hypothetical protein